MERERARGRPGLLVVTGAPGVGKTTAVRTLAARAPWSWLRCLHFDQIGVPSEDRVMQHDFGRPERWQADATDRWFRRIAAEALPGSVTILDGQTRPSLLPALLRADNVEAPPAARAAPPLELRQVLLDCSPEVREERLLMRGRPELVNSPTEAWALYLRGQADALGLPVIDTTHLTPDGVADALEREVEALRAAAGRE